MGQPYTFRTRNLRESENQAHTREGATARGFRGSIVGGAIVYGRMIHPLIERWGETWLERSRLDVRFKAPAYDDDTVEARFEASTGDGGESRVTVRARNADGVELVELRGSLPDTLPEPDALARIEPVEWQGERVEGTWDRVALARPFRAYRFHVTREEQDEYCDATGDELALYRDGSRPPAHPGLVMAQGSRVVANQFVMPFWIHASSTLAHRRVIRVGDEIELRCVPIDKWRRGESEWVRFYQVYLAGEEPALEVWKTSVIKVAPATRFTKETT
ncbi:MAG TPA: hypothetical protein VMS86_10340 [Thermoanaerobaculia bacterium]|nr:hypothetical protein [Thermoanaerobaculia bacterium]